MGYNLGIGEFEVDTAPEDRYVCATVKHHEVASAPVNSTGAADDRSNWIFPGYGAWAEFCKRTGLSDVFYDRPEAPRSGEAAEHEAVIAAHPGCVALTEFHARRFRAALVAYGPDKPRKDGEPDYDAVRLRWLVFWTDWALANCKYPSMANS